MKIHELELTAKPNRKRVGRGISAGQGKTAGRGTKGQNSRTGGGVRPGFEGGQNPLAKRLPKKRGFASLNPTTYQIVNLSQLDRLKDGAKVTTEMLAKEGLVKSPKLATKLLAQGEITKKLSIELQAASKSAIEAVAKAGGTVKIAELARVTKSSTKPKGDA